MKFATPLLSLALLAATALMPSAAADTRTVCLTPGVTLGLGCVTGTLSHKPAECDSTGCTVTFLFDATATAPACGSIGKFNAFCPESVAVKAFHGEETVRYPFFGEVDVSAQLCALTPDPDHSFESCVLLRDHVVLSQDPSNGLAIPPLPPLSPLHGQGKLVMVTVNLDHYLTDRVLL